MKKVKVLHNPTAGEGEASKEDVIRKIESAGFKCSYSSTKDFCWENIETEEVDFLVLAGGDGTVRKIAEEMLDRKVIEKKFPIALLPMGTANNIAKTLGVSGKQEDIIQGWHHGVTGTFDVGIIKGLKAPAFFLESFGYGLFPKLMFEMKKQKKNNIEDPKAKLQAALRILDELTSEAPAKGCELNIDGKDYSGRFLLIEVMNTRSIGPNLILAPGAKPGDGAFDVVLIAEDQRTILGEYVRRKIYGREVLFDFSVIKARQIQIRWEGKHFHVDDEHYKRKDQTTIDIGLRDGLLEFLLPPGPGIQ